MLRNFIAAAMLTTLAGTTAYAADVTVSTVEVTADLTAIQNEKAAAYWSNITTDLQDAIVARLVDRIAEDGAEIRVDLREVELASSFDRAIGASDAVLVGQVNVDDNAGNAGPNNYELTITLGTAPVISADGTTVMYDSLDTPESYQALVGAFADGVVSRLN